MPKFVKKPIVIDAEQFTDENKDRVFNFVRCNCRASDDAGRPTLDIQTLEGVMTASLGDWIIQGVTGEFYPCKPDVFEQTYSPWVQPGEEEGEEGARKPEDNIIEGLEEFCRATGRER